LQSCLIAKTSEEEERSRERFTRGLHGPMLDQQIWEKKGKKAREKKTNAERDEPR
jgi:hypothetical protein